ncbi:Heat shock protein 70 [Entamoeba marina]
MSNYPEYAFGIDLGTSNSAISYYDVEKKEVISIIFNDVKFTPSVVYYPPKGGSVICGEAARRRTGPNVINQIKRLIGRKYSEIDKKHALYTSYDITKTTDDEVVVSLTINGNKVNKTPEEITTELFKYLKSGAIDAGVGNDRINAVITCPSNFNLSQKEKTIQAARNAGINVLSMITEPTAAAIAYLEDSKRSEKTVLVIDLGGGTLDVSIVIEQNSEYHVKCTSGDTHFGGVDIDQTIANYIMEINPDLKDLITSKKSKRALLRRCEEAKWLFSNETTQYVEISLDGVIKDVDTSLMQLEVTYDEFVRINSEIINKIDKKIDEALQVASLSEKDLNCVLLVGGPTKLVFIKQHFTKRFGEVLSSIDPMLAVCKGAAIRAAKQGGTFVDVVPISLGLCNLGVLFERIIPANSSLPICRERIMKTSKENQRTIKIEVFEGESDICLENTRLKDVIIDLGEPQPKATPVIVSFCINTNGLFSVSAKISNDNYTHTFDIDNITSHTQKHSITSTASSTSSITSNNKTAVLLNLRGIINDIEVDEKFPTHLNKTKLIAFKKCNAFDSYEQLMEACQELKNMFRSLENIKDLIEYDEQKK